MFVQALYVSCLTSSVASPDIKQIDLQLDKIY